MCCRIRLMSAQESSDAVHKEKGYTISNGDQSLSTDNKKKFFNFDKIYSENAEQEKLWREAKKVIKDTIHGSDAAIICYGQTASGKTFTIQGTEKEPGIILRSIEYVEQQIIEYKGQLSVTCWMGEIYMQEFKDLFRSPAAKVEPMWINEDGTIAGITLLSAKNA